MLGTLMGLLFVGVLGTNAMYLTSTVVVTTIYTTNDQTITSTTQVPTTIETITETSTATEIQTATSYETVVYEQTTCKKQMKCPSGTKYISSSQPCMITHYADGTVSSTCVADNCCTAKDSGKTTVVTSCQAAGVQCKQYSYMLTDSKGASVPCYETYKNNKLVSTTCTTDTCCTDPEPPSTNVPCNEVIKCKVYKKGSSNKVQTCSTTKSSSNICTVDRCCATPYTTSKISTTKVTTVTSTPKTSTTVTKVVTTTQTAGTTKKTTTITTSKKKTTNKETVTKTTTATAIAVSTVTMTYTPQPETVVIEKTTCKAAMKCSSGTKYISDSKSCQITYTSNIMTSTTCTNDICCTSDVPNTTTVVTSCQSAKITCPQFSYLLTDSKQQSVPCVDTYEGNKKVATTCTVDTCCTEPEPDKLVPCNDVIKCDAYKVDTSTNTVVYCRTEQGDSDMCTVKKCCATSGAAPPITTTTTITTTGMGAMPPVSTTTAGGLGAMPPAPATSTAK